MGRSSIWKSTWFESTFGCNDFPFFVMVWLFFRRFRHEEEMFCMKACSAGLGFCLHDYRFNEIGSMHVLSLVRSILRHCAEQCVSDALATYHVMGAREFVWVQR